MSENEEQEPMWEANVIKNLDDLVRNVGAEGMERLIFKSATPMFNLAEEHLMQYLGRDAGSVLGTGLFNTLVDSCDTGLKLGFALALTVSEGLKGNEAWLQAAMSESGLTSYKPTMLFDERSISDLADANKQNVDENEAPGDGEQTTLLNVDQQQLVEKFQEYLERASSDRQVIDVVLSVPGKKRQAVLQMAELMFIKGVEAVISDFAKKFPWMVEPKRQ